MSSMNADNHIWVKTLAGEVAFIDMETGLPITDPFLSADGSFEVDPEEEYDLDADLAVQMIMANGSLHIAR